MTSLTYKYLHMMTKNIEDLREKKFPNPFNSMIHPALRVFSELFLVMAAAGLVLCIFFAFYGKTLHSILVAYLYATSAGCLFMSLGYLIMRQKVKRMNKYQEELVQAIYDCLKQVERQAERQDEQYIDLRSRLNSLTYMTFRHSMCPELEQFRSFMNAVESNLDLTDLSEQIKEKILYDEFTTPCSIVRSEEWLVDYLDGEELFALYRKMHSRHPLIAELDIVPQLLRHVIDSADGYSLSHYGRK